MVSYHMFKNKMSDVKPDKFYVYLHRRCTDNVVFYVGKGVAGRAWQKSGRNGYWKNVFDKHGANVEIVEDGLNEKDAYGFTWNHA